MRIRVLLFARLREIAGREALDLELPSGATVGEVWRHLQERTEALKGYPHPPLMAVKNKILQQKRLIG